MIKIKPFKALRPVKEYSSKVASRPYDVLNRMEAKEAAKGNEYSYLHITKSEIDLPDFIPLHSHEVYEQAKHNLKYFIDKKILFQEDHPCYYIYELTMNHKAQTGLVCLSSVEDYFDNRIKKHEFTRPDKEKDRIDHMSTIMAQTGNVFLACYSVEEMNMLIENWQSAHEPVYDFVSEDGVRHAVWVIDAEKTIYAITQLANEKISATYIADGHHRAASAANVSRALAGNEKAQYFLTTIFPDKDLQIMDYNRVVKDLNGLDDEAFFNALKDSFDMETSLVAVKPERAREFGMYINGTWYRLFSKSGIDHKDVIGVLDVSILSDHILEKILGIQDQRTNSRIDFVGGIRGLTELEKRVDSGDMKVAFSLFPVTIQQLFAVADSGQVMPPKSTWFEPKLRDGLLTHLI
ncbi:MAG TPA: DUF1015 family protein [Niabella sp.]|nr:DUF1015 family protein [Niabella sp.]HOZ97325.1 DUF1015 family protein [Niabella sp.]HQW15404.1 DUF1015 family protein [Niabella sp.]HQX20550.1 DUF1015 family protein [Niabella sp.]HQX41083.1 DUF1015 family protein [Niabella sp.]